MPLPAYRESTPAGPKVVDCTGRLERLATKEEVARLRSSTSATNGLLETLILVVNGFEDDRYGLMKDYSIQQEDCLSRSLFSEPPT